MKKLLLTAILLLAAISLFGCSGEELPEGMQLVNGGVDKGYYFYAPEEWTVSNVAAIDAAYASKTDNSSVTFAEIDKSTFPLAEGESAKDYFFNKYFEDSLKEYPDSITPKITVNGQVLEGEDYEVACPSTGSFDFSGVIELPRGDGSIQPYEFASSYIVGEPTAIISADMMNVFYAGIQNPISASVPGVPAQNISLNITNADVTRTGKGWSVKPRKVGTPCVVSVSAKMADGKVQSIGRKEFRVKALPDPVAYISYKAEGREQKYKGQGKPIAKGNLISAPGIRAELPDADLDVRYRVVGYALTFFDSMGNSMEQVSNSAEFTPAQKQTIQRMTKGKKFFISRIKAVGPDGITRTLPAIDVTVN